MAVGQNLAGMHDQMTQQVEFLRRQLHLMAAPSDMAADQIDREVARDKDRKLALCLEGVAQRRAQSRHQLGHTKGLADIVVGAEIEGLDLRALVVAGLTKR